MIFDIRKHFEKTKFITEEGTFRSREGERKRGNLLIGRMGKKEREDDVCGLGQGQLVMLPFLHVIDGRIPQS